MRSFLLVLTVILFVFNCLLGQPTTISPSSSLSCALEGYGLKFDYSQNSNPDIASIPSTYHGTSKKDKKVFICSSRLPVIVTPIEIVDPITNSSLPLASENFVWKGSIDGSYGEDFEAKLKDSNFGSNATFSVEFTIGDEEVKIEVEVYKDPLIELDLSKSERLSKAAFDKNNHKYDNFATELPWKVHLGTEETVEIMGRKVKSLQNIDFNDYPNESIFDYTSETRKLNLNLLSLQSGKQTRTVAACNEDIFKIDYLQKKVLKIHVYVICESDDDEINYCLDDPYKDKLCQNMITPNHRCLLPGSDGSLDLYASLKSYASPMDEIEKFVGLGHQNYIRAGGDGKCDSNIFKAANDEDCPVVSQTEVEEYLREATDLLYSTAGIELELVWHGEIKRNFDSRNDDNRLDRSEQVDLTRETIGGSTALETVVFIVDKFEFGSPKVGGRALTGNNTLAIQLKNTGDGRRWTAIYAHEIGHAKWGMAHPEALTPPVYDDNENFMKKEYDVNSDAFINFKLYKYQWDEF